VLAPETRKLRTIQRASEIDQRMMSSSKMGERFILKFRRSFQRYYFVYPPIWRILLRAAFSRERMTPSFASLGAVRSGTTMLADYLMQHPCVVLPLAKEIGIGVPTKRLVSAQFPTLREQKEVEARYGAGRAITGYCSPNVPYLAFAHLAVEIAPDLRFILILRDPVDRTFAHWRWDQVLFASMLKDPMWRRYPDFDECVKMELESMRSNGAGLFTISGVGAGGYIRHSIYLPFIRNLFRFFNRDRVMIVNSRDFFTDSAGVAKEAYKFLGLPEYEPVVMPVRNAGPAGTMSESTQEALREFFRPLNQELYEFLGRDFGWQ